jgi:hypothetical protein
MPSRCVAVPCSAIVKGARQKCQENRSREGESRTTATSGAREEVGGIKYRVSATRVTRLPRAGLLNETTL